MLSSCIRRPACRSSGSAPLGWERCAVCARNTKGRSGRKAAAAGLAGPTAGCQGARQGADLARILQEECVKNAGEVGVKYPVDRRRLSSMNSRG
jgi:hypothetical protein